MGSSVRSGTARRLLTATGFFLPLLPKQILLNNFLSDLPSVAISTDNVDREQILHPQRWNVNQARRFMTVFGLLSSSFDILTFALLLLVFQAAEITFHPFWLIVSVLTEIGFALVACRAIDVGCPCCPASG